MHLTSTPPPVDDPEDPDALLRTQLAELRRDVAELKDREAIRSVLDTYAFLLDSARWLDIPNAVFTEDAIDHHSPQAGAEPRGRAEIAQFLDATMRGHAGSQHLLGNSSIEIDGDTAHSRTYAICSHWSSDGPDPLPSDMILAAAYDDQWERTPVGWRISERWVHTFGPHALLAGHRASGLPRLGSDLYGSRDRGHHEEGAPAAD